MRDWATSKRPIDWQKWLQGIALGLWLSRVVAESSASSWRLLWLLPLVAIGLLLGMIVVVGLRSRLGHTWPFCLLFIYVLCPLTSPALAYGLLLAVVLLGVLLNWSPQRGLRWLPWGVFGASLGLYLSTLAPDMLPADSGEFQFIGHVLGIAHPPGYALYTLLSKLFTLLPMGSVAYRVNLFGAICGALTLALLAGALLRSARSTSAALLASAMLGLSATFWAQSTTANIRTLTTLLVMLCLALLLRWREERSQRYLTAFALCFGLGIGHHASIGLLGLPFVAYILVEDWRILRQPRRWLRPLIAFFASFLVLLYLPLRSAMNPSFDPHPMRTWSDFVSHVLASGFRGDMLYYRTWPELAPRLGIWWNILRLQFGPALPLTALAAAIPLAWRKRRVLLLLGGVWAINTLAVVTYRAPQTVEYLLPSYLALVALLAFGVAELAQWIKSRQLAAILTTILALLALVNGLGNYGSFCELHRDTSTRDYAQTILENAPPEALLLSNWHHATAFWYLQQVEGTRTDVEVRYVYPEGATPNEAVWLRRIDEAIGRRPVLVTNRFHAFAQSGYQWLPFHGAWLVSQAPLTSPPVTMRERQATFGQRMQILGYELDQDSIQPGEALSVRVYWRPIVELERDYSSFVQLLGAQGVVGQGDISQPTSSYLPGQIRVDEYRFPLLLQTPPGQYQLISGFYQTTETGWQRLTTDGGGDHLVLSEPMVRPADVPPATLHRTSQRLSGGLELVGFDIDRTVPMQTRLYLHWRRRHSMLDRGPWQAAPLGALVVRAMAGETAIAQAVLPELVPGQAATIVLDLAAEQSEIALAVHRPDGGPLPWLGPWHRAIAAGPRLELPARPAAYVPLGGEMTYIGLANAPASIASGDTMWLRPRFLALRPLTKDYSVSVGLCAVGGDWEYKSDGTPALGAIPTLKWMRGWRLADPHRLSLGDDLEPGPATITLTVYDAFTLGSLHILDERLARQGQGITLQIGDLQQLD